MQYTIIDWVLITTAFCLNQEPICCPKPQASDNRSIPGSHTLLLSEKPVYNCFVINIYFYKIFLFTLSTGISIRWFQYPRPLRQRIWKTPWHCDVNITWLIEPMKRRPSVNSSIAGNRCMNCWPVNRTVLQLIGILLLTVKILCIYCIALI